MLQRIFVIRRICNFRDYLRVPQDVKFIYNMNRSRQEFQLLYEETIVHSERGCLVIRKYDVLYVNRMDRSKHLQVDAKRVETILGTITYLSSSSSSTELLSSSQSSSSSDNFCPNNIHSWNSSVFIV